jgi:hypothetical protein
VLQSIQLRYLLQDFSTQSTQSRHSMNVTRAVSPVMRKQRSGLLLTVSSTAGISGGVFCTAYAAAKFGVEGWMKSLAPEIAPVRYPYHAGRTRFRPHRTRYYRLDYVCAAVH